MEEMKKKIRNKTQREKQLFKIEIKKETFQSYR